MNDEFNNFEEEENMDFVPWDSSDKEAASKALATLSCRLINRYASFMHNPHGLVYKLNKAKPHLKEMFYNDISDGLTFFTTSDLEFWAPKWDGFDKLSKSFLVDKAFLPKKMIFDIDTPEKNTIQLIYQKGEYDEDMLGEAYFDRNGKIKKIQSVYNSSEYQPTLKERNNEQFDFMVGYLVEKNTIHELDVNPLQKSGRNFEM